MAYTKKFRAQFVESFRKSLGNVTITCRNMGININTYYKWMKEHPDFRKECLQIKEQERGDFYENALIKRIEEGDTTAIIFALKTQCKDRGYVERQEITGADGRDLVVPSLTQEDFDIVREKGGFK